MYGKKSPQYGKIISLQLKRKKKQTLSIRPGTIKHLEDNIEKTFSDINRTNSFLGQTTKPIEIKMKINTWDSIKVIRFCTAKKTINK